MQTFDVIVIGGGIIGVSLAIELRRRQLDVLVLDRGQPGSEASAAGAGMLVASEVESPAQLCELALRSAVMYPDFVREAEVTSGLAVDFSRTGAITLAYDQSRLRGEPLSGERLAHLEPALAASSFPAAYVPEDFVDPRTLMPALIAWAKATGAHIHGGAEVESLTVEREAITGVRTTRTSFRSEIVVNCAGAWAGQIGGVNLPTRPVKGHMLALLPQKPYPIQHVIRHRELEVYLVPRRDGRIAVGSTLEEAGFDKLVDTATIQRLHQLAADIIPELGEARLHESWTGLRPATPDGLPLLGPTSLLGYFVATGHFRNGILLAPASALAIAELVTGAALTFDLTPFSPQRF